MHDNLPDTQPDTQTQTQTPASLDCIDSLNIKTPWGRLFPCITFLDPVDLLEPKITLGRSEHCDIVILNSKFPQNKCLNISKCHFVITREPSFPVYITDLSKNGTYVNANLIGRNKKVVLQNDDIISIGHKNLKVYIYKPIAMENNEYLPLELRKKYEISTLLGRGACGEVRLAFEKLTCKSFAIKKITKAKNNTSHLHDINHPTKIKNEIEILQNLSHAFIIKLKEIVETDKEVFIVLDYMPGGELTNRILSVNSLTESNVKFLFYQIVLAVQYLHKAGITHRDLKPENILLTSDNPDALIKVSDFGLSKIIHEETVMQTICGTPNYVAPEIIDGRVTKYDQKVDIWSLGVILFYMLGKELPFSASDKQKIGYSILQCKLKMNTVGWMGVSHEAQDLVKKMLTVDPKKRLSIEEVLNHPWISKDLVMQYKVSQLMKNNDEEGDSDDLDETFTESVGPPSKRRRIITAEEDDDATN